MKILKITCVVSNVRHYGWLLSIPKTRNTVFHKVFCLKTLIIVRRKLINYINIVIEKKITLLWEEGLSENDHTKLWTVPRNGLQVVILWWMKLDKLHIILHHTKTYPIKQGWGSMLLNKALYIRGRGGWWLSFKTVTVHLEHPRFYYNILYMLANNHPYCVINHLYSFGNKNFLSTFSSFVPVSLFNYHPSSLEFPPQAELPTHVDQFLFLSWISSFRKNSLGLKVPKSVCFKAQITSRLPSKYNVHH